LARKGVVGKQPSRVPGSSHKSGGSGCRTPLSSLPSPFSPAHVDFKRCQANCLWVRTRQSPLDRGPSCLDWFDFVWSIPRPLRQNPVDLLPHLRPGVEPVGAGHQQLIVIRVRMTDMSPHRQIHRPCIQRPAGRCRPLLRLPVCEAICRHSTAGQPGYRRCIARVSAATNSRSSSCRTIAACFLAAARTGASAAHSASALTKPASVTSTPCRS